MTSSCEREVRREVNSIAVNAENMEKVLLREETSISS